jgi:predicted nuclease of predicted toxin-antitoxin system
LILWIDAQLSRHLAPWLRQELGVEAYSAGKLGLRDAKDREIFEAARKPGVIVLTKDQDFVRLLETFGPPPQILWITCGNTSNAHLKELLSRTLRQALELFARGEPLIEIGDALPGD